MGRDTPSLLPTQIGAMGVLNMAGEVTGEDVEGTEGTTTGVDISSSSSNSSSNSGSTRCTSRRRRRRSSSSLLLRRQPYQ